MLKQTIPYSLNQYIEAGCLTLTREGELDSVGLYIHTASDGMPCNVCHMRETNCPAFAKLRGTSVIYTATANPVETVRAEAARRGISIGEVRRQRVGIVELAPVPIYGSTC